MIKITEAKACCEPNYYGLEQRELDFEIVKQKAQLQKVLDQIGSAIEPDLADDGFSSGRTTLSEVAQEIKYLYFYLDEDTFQQILYLRRSAEIANANREGSEVASEVLDNQIEEIRLQTDSYFSSSCHRAGLTVGAQVMVNHFNEKNYNNVWSSCLNSLF